MFFDKKISPVVVIVKKFFLLFNSLSTERKPLLINLNLEDTKSSKGSSVHRRVIVRKDSWPKISAGLKDKPLLIAQGGAERNLIVLR